MNDNAKIQRDDEISLLDLFTVLLRYRKLIIGIILLFVILSIAGYFIYPAYQYKKGISELQTQGIIQMEIVPKAQSLVSQKLENFIKRPDTIYDALLTAGMKNFSYGGETVPMDDKNKTTVMYLINQLWVQNLNFNGNVYAQKEHNKTFSVKSSKESSVVEVTFKDKDSEIVKIFMEALFNLCTVSIEENIRINAKMMVSNYERIMNLPKVSESMQMILEKDYDAYVFLKNFLEGKEAIVKLVSESVLVENPVFLILFKKQYERTGIIIVCAGFFLAVMLAFVLNAVRNIKNDEEAMKKIKDALGNSGSK